MSQTRNLSSGRWRSLRALRALTFGAVCILLAVEWLMMSHAFVAHSEELDVIYGNAIPSVEDLADMLDGLTDIRRDTRRMILEPSGDDVRSDTGTRAASAVAALK